MRTRGGAYDELNNNTGTNETTTNNLETNKNSKCRVPEARLLQQEKDWYLRQNRAIPRTAIYRPSLEEFQSTPFEDYIRYTLMGVGCECCRVKPTFRNQSPEQTFCKYKMRDGMAKVVPPSGWWDYEGIGRDLTGRGPAWQAGTKIGDLNLEKK